MKTKVAHVDPLEARRARLIPAEENSALLRDPTPDAGFTHDSRWYSGDDLRTPYGRAPDAKKNVAVEETEERPSGREAFPSPYAGTEIVLPVMAEKATAADVRDAARLFTAEALVTIVDIMRNSCDPKTRMTAAEAVLNRAIGKPVAPVGALSAEDTAEMLGTIILPAKETDGIVEIGRVGAGNA